MPSVKPRLAFAGTPAFAATHLEALLEAGLPPLAVLCQPDRASGRGRRQQACPVKQLAETAGIPVLQPETIRHPDPVASLLDLDADLLVVVAYGQILPRSLVDGFRAGAYNVHASLLPRWRGAAPIQRAIEAGDPETGVTIQRMVERLDAGDVVCSARLPITSQDTSASLHDALADLGARTLVSWLQELDLDQPPAGSPQDEALVTYAARLDKAESWIDWQSPASTLQRRIRAFDPWPGTRSRVGDQEFRIWQAAALADPSASAPGTILVTPQGELQIACGQGVLAIHELQFPGGRRLSTREVLNARSELFAPGACLG